MKNKCIMKMGLCILGALLLFFLGAVTAIMFQTAVLQTPRYTPDIQPQSIPISYHLEAMTIPEGDSINIVTLVTDSRLDSMTKEIQHLKERHQWLTHQHDNIVSDIRQENNNFLDKVNAWLTFWLAASAILCILLPISIQYFNFRTERKDLINHINRLKYQLIGHKETIKAQQKEIHQQKELQQGLHLLQIGIDNSLLDPGDLTHGSYIYDLWKRIYIHIRNINTGLLENKRLEEVDQNRLIETLLYMYDYVNQLQRIIPKYRSRSFLKFKDSIDKLYRDIRNNQFETIESLKQETDNTTELFRQLLNNSSATPPQD